MDATLEKPTIPILGLDNTLELEGPEDTWVGVREAAKILRCDEKTLRGALKRGQIKAREDWPSGYFRFRMSDITRVKALRTRTG